MSLPTGYHHSQDLHMNPCYENPDDEKKNEKYPILSDRNDESHYTEEDLTDIEDDLTSVHTTVTTIKKQKNSTFSHLFAVSVIIIELLGVCCLVTVTCWMIYFQNGLAWDGGQKELNWHPIFMVAGIVFYTNAALSSYVLRGHKESVIHYLHGLSLLLTFIFTTLGMVSGLSTKDGINFVSFHSGIGVITILLFATQVVIGFIGLFPKCKSITRKKYLKFQIWICLVVFIFAVITCLVGSSEKIALKMTSTTTGFSYEAILANIFSLLLLIYGCFVSTILLHPAYRKA